jgi:diguanylate cyclase (GGDEF)-like protein/PAS domain S-box-containing protein
MSGLYEIVTDPLFHQNVLDSLFDGVYVVSLDRSITYWNKGAERIAGYSSQEIVGRRCFDNLLIHIDGTGLSLCHGLCPLARTMKDGETRQQELFLHHKDGHRVPVMVRVVPLRGPDGRIIGGIEVFSDNTSSLLLRHKIEELEKANMIDGLTRLCTRGHVEVQMASELAKMGRYGWTFGVLFVDIDNFKRINDTYGHEIGDKVLKMVASTLSLNSRPFDTIGRWGGEEFVGVLVNVDAAQVFDIADRLRILVEQSKFFLGPSAIHVTVSIGATVARPDDTMSVLVDRADKLMYQSKLAGRNRVTADRGTLTLNAS